MFRNLLTHQTAHALPIHLVSASTLNAWLKKAPAAHKAWVESHRFEALPDTALMLPAANGKPAAVLAGVAPALTPWSLAALPALLPAGTYKIATALSAVQHAQLALGVLLAQYQFSRYRRMKNKPFVLALPKNIALTPVTQLAEATALARDLINTPTNDMGPKELAAEAKKLAHSLKAEYREIVGDDLLKKNYPAIHAVGRASPNAPRLIDIRWGNTKHPKLTLVGKGVCFDTGGLDLKPLSAMRLMKKDMGGAALMLALATLVIRHALPVRLRVLIPAVENSVSGNAFRPQDIIRTRKGLSVEIGSTDAEGRVILCDALTEADSESPDLILDAATLTGAARTALGTELPALFSNQDKLARDLQTISHATHDPMWHLPLWQGYDKYVSSPIADITNSPNYNFAGAITAALYLQRFVRATTPWVHIDTYAWNAEAQPGRPIGGEALCLRALFAYLQKRYAT
jgi:leucyl aminopeptidase